MYFTLECTIYNIHVQNLAPGTVDCTTLLQEMMRTDLVAVVLLQHMKQLALDGTAPFASVSFEFPLGDHLHLCRQSFCFRVHQNNEKIEL